MKYFSIFIAILFLTMFAGTGCVNLAEDVILPTAMLKADLTTAEKAQIQTKSLSGEIKPTVTAGVVLNVERVAKIKNAETNINVAKTFLYKKSDTDTNPVLPEVYSGLEILNRAAGNGPGSTSALKALSASDVTNFVRYIPIVGPDGKTASTNEITILYDDAEAPLNPKFVKNANVSRALAAMRIMATNGTPSGSSIHLLTSRGLARDLVKAVNPIHSDTSRQTNMAVSLGSMFSAATNTNSQKAITVRLDAIAFAYMQAYLEGNFVARDGTPISQPDISEKLGADTITSFEQVLLEAVYDYATMTPIVYNKPVGDGTNQPQQQFEVATKNSSNQNAASSAKPTFVTLFPDFYQASSTKPDEIGVTPAELKFITFLQGLGGEGSKHLSSLIVRFLGGVDVGGKLSLGDNDSVSKVVSTFCDALIGDAVNTIGYDFFEKFEYKTNNGNYVSVAEANQNNLKITKAEGDAIAKALQYEDILVTLTNLSAAKTNKTSQ